MSPARACLNAEPQLVVDHSSIRYVLRMAFFVIAWSLVTLLSLPFAGFSETPPATWHPSSRMANAMVLGNRRMAAGAAFLLAIFLLASPLLLPKPASFATLGVAYFMIVPAPFFLIDAIRRDRLLRNVEFVLFNSVAPISTRFERKVVGTDLKEVRAKVAFFIQDWKRIPLAGIREREYLDNFHEGGGLYVARAESDFLQLFDSLNLYQYVVNPENEEAIHAFREGLKAEEKLIRYLKSAPKPIAVSQPAPAVCDKASQNPELNLSSGENDHLLALSNTSGTTADPEKTPGESLLNEATVPASNPEASLSPNTIASVPKKKPKSQRNCERPPDEQQKLVFAPELNPAEAAA